MSPSSYKKLYDVVVMSPGLPKSVQMVFTRLADLAAAGFERVRIATIARDVQCGESTVRRAIGVLREMGAISTVRMPYWLVFEIAEQARWNAIFASNFTAPDRSKRAVQTAQNERTEPPVSIYLKDLSKRTKEAAADTTSGIEENSPPPPQKQPQMPERKPPARATTGAPVDFEGYSDWIVEEYRVMLKWHSSHLHLPPADDFIVRRVLDATGGADPNEAHKVMLELHKRRRFENIQSWGLIPLVLGSWFPRMGQNLAQA